MNYLAHVFLSHESPQAIVGAMLGDFVKGPVDNNYSPAIRNAILLHRAIDRYTDSHPTPHASRMRITAARRRFAAVLIDVFYDHFLACHWQEYCDVSLPIFAQRVYAALALHREELPAPLQWVASRMTTDNWLIAYRQIDGIAAVVNGIARRLQRYRRAAVLIGGVDELKREYAALENDFQVFFPQLMAYVAATPIKS